MSYASHQIAADREVPFSALNDQAGPFVF